MEIEYRQGDGDVVIGIKKNNNHSLFGSINGTVKEFEDAVLALSNIIREWRCEEVDAEFVPPEETVADFKKNQLVEAILGLTNVIRGLVDDGGLREPAGDGN